MRNTDLSERCRCRAYCSRAASAWGRGRGGGGRPKQLILGTESVEAEVETAWAGMGISPAPLVLLSHFSSSPWVDGLALHGVDQLRQEVLQQRGAAVFYLPFGFQGQQRPWEASPL